MRVLTSITHHWRAFAAGLLFGAFFAANALAQELSLIHIFLSYAEVDWGGVMAAAVAIMAPVSYTHLDVYKRQIERHRRIRQVGEPCLVDQT